MAPTNPRPALRVAVWAVGAVAYLAAIMSRTSLSATGGLASERYDLTSDQLAMFGILQLLVYAGVQIPVGMVIDRVGARVTMLSGVAIIAVSQLMVGFGDVFSVLLAGRALAGLGDAMVFPSAIRLIAVTARPAWISPGIQLLGVVGNVGVVLTATPLLAIIDIGGWPTGFAVLAAFSGVAALVAGLVLALTGPDRTRTAGGESIVEVVRGTGEVARYPGTWLAFAAHLVGNVPYTVFIVTWGSLLLSHGAGLDGEGLGLALAGLPVCGAITGIAFGRLARDGGRARTAIVVGTGIAHIASWALLLFWPQPTPAILVGLLVFTVAAGGPASLMGFDLARELVPGRLAARANGIVNMAGFTGGLISVWLTGLVLTSLGATTPDAYSMDVFRIAFLPMLALIALGIGVFLLLGRRLRRASRD
ncbi:MFS transporter [Microbacterium sp. gxy059]|uniref:MFS transporter n=1 Tax=Microbacterium sp. gxy059 TaxID=2957199 RepID=UPI003D98E9BA